MGAIIGLVVSLAPALIGLVEKLFAPKSGTQKADTVNAALLAILADLKAKGAIPASLDPSQLATVIETIFQQMTQSGQINVPVVPAPAPIGPVTGGSFILTFRNGGLQSVG